MSGEGSGPSGRPDETHALTRGQRIRLVIKIVELRLRFVALMAATGLTFAYWDELAGRFEKWRRPGAEAHATAAAGLEFYCPMHPQVVQAEPGSCPICGMPLAKRKAGESAPLPAGVTARVELAPFRVEQAGVRTVAVGYAPLSERITTVGDVAFDERRLANIIARVPGRSRVEKLHVNVTGQEVEVGQVLAELYSPELSQALQELLSAARRASASGATQTDVGRSLMGDRREMLRASTEKLRRWGLTDAQIDAVVRSGKADATIPILAPIRGTIVKKNVVEGQEVSEGFAMFEAADLRGVWIVGRVFERQLGKIKIGQAVEATVEAYPGRTFPGKLEFIQPSVDPATRTVEVRYALDNPDMRLRPGMFASVTLDAPLADAPEYRTRQARAGGATTPEEQQTCLVTKAKLGSMGPPVKVDVAGRTLWACCKACEPRLKAEPARYLARLDVAPEGSVLSVPEAAVIDTGTRKVVYIESAPGVFEGREVVLGPRSGDRYPVLDGLSPGDRVAAAGAFLIDAESRLNPGKAPSPEAQPAPTPAADQPAPHLHRAAEAGRDDMLRR